MSDPNIPIQSFPIGEPTSALDFEDLILEVAEKLGCAYYGPDGESAAAIPEDAHDLDMCQRIVNKGIRMFLNDAPAPNGWKFSRPIAQVDLWPQIAYDSAPSPSTYVNIVDNGNNTSTLTLTTPGIQPPPTTTPYQTTPSFYNSMEFRQIFLNGNPPPGTPGFPPTTTPIYTIASLTQVGGIATLTLTTPHGLGKGAQASVIGANPPGYNKVFTVLTTPTPYILTYAVSSSLASPATQPGSLYEGAYLQGSPYTILQYVNPTTLIIDNGPGTAPISAGFPTNCPFSFAAAGDYTLPANFAGEYCGQITYIANTNRGMILSWCSEEEIRSRRQNYNIESGTPYQAAVRLMPTPSYNVLTNTSGLMIPRRRWELMTWRISSEFLSVIFPYVLAFNSLVNLTDIPPVPFSHDETVKAACLAWAEKERWDKTDGPDWMYYKQDCLKNSYRIDAMSAPKALGYNSNPYASASRVPVIRGFRDYWYQRPPVSVNPVS